MSTHCRKGWERLNIRFNVKNEEVIEILEKVDKTNRKFFIEEAILNYYKMLQNDLDRHSIFLKVEKNENAIKYYR